MSAVLCQGTTIVVPYDVENTMGFSPEGTRSRAQLENVYRLRFAFALLLRFGAASNPDKCSNSVTARS